MIYSRNKKIASKWKELSIVTRLDWGFQPFQKLMMNKEPANLLTQILAELRKRGIFENLILTNPEIGRKTDIAIMHFNPTVVPVRYLEYASTFPVCINNKVSNISKRNISGALIADDSTWTGPVIVKSDLNFGGFPEVKINKYALMKGLDLPYPGVKPVKTYTVYDSFKEVPTETLENSNLVVEKFIPERQDDNFAVRYWVFCGEREHCNRYTSPKRIIKGGNFVSKTPAPVPEEIRARRKELGFDFGKFDFVMHQGKGVLLDANKTPSRLPYEGEDSRSALTNLADGLEILIDRKLAEIP